MTTGIDLPNLIRFFIQVGVAVGGAASLWGFIYGFRKKKNPGFHKLTELLMILFFIAFLIFVVSWWVGAIFFFLPDAQAHEGITIKPAADLVQNGFRATLWPVVLFVLVSLYNLHLFFDKREVWHRRATWLFFTQFIIMTFISLFSVYTLALDYKQTFFAFHSWHSILTLGGVITVDFLILMTLSGAAKIKQSLYKSFYVISSLVWVGLGLDFLSNLFIFEEAFKINQQFLFIQTVIAILIINGILLSGRISDVFLERSARLKEFGHTFKRLVSISGAVSIVSWLTITFVDFFNFNFLYWQFLLIYLGIILVAFFTHRGVDNWLEGRKLRSLEV